MKNKYYGHRVYKYLHLGNYLNFDLAFESCLYFRTCYYHHTPYLRKELPTCINTDLYFYPLSLWKPRILRHKYLFIHTVCNISISGEDYPTDSGSESLKSWNGETDLECNQLKPWKGHIFLCLIVAIVVGKSCKLSSFWTDASVLYYRVTPTELQFSMQIIREKKEKVIKILSCTT